MKTTLPENLTPRTYDVLHVTRYTYDKQVDRCYERGLLAPRECASQTLVETEIDVTPEASLLTEHVDAFGNRSHYLEVQAAHTLLEVQKRSIVRVAWPAYDLAALDRWSVADAAAALRSEPRFADERLWYALPTRLTPATDAVRAYAATQLDPEAPLGQALSALVTGVNHDFKYAPGATTVRTTLDELLELRAGVCQDFTHLMLGCLRAVGLPCRYVSGYIETSPPPGKPKLAGSDATHAWGSVLTPDGQWIDLDPTNNQTADSRYIVNAWGRDFGDVSPLRGIIVSNATKSTLKVEVTVTRLDDPASPTTPVE